MALSYYIGYEVNIFAVCDFVCWKIIQAIFELNVKYSQIYLWYTFSVEGIRHHKAIAIANLKGRIELRTDGKSENTCFGALSMNKRGRTRTSGRHCGCQYTFEPSGGGKRHFSAHDA